ncbi:kinase-like domain-containing protein [Fomitopsis serialis]|uniref:kinase-like domain-containing protein n=1 Tax=Fomitopsis serialis TaxID=139415 RepID=UPI002008086A|nr:kinase-like domain-containing protein [Neoantrodia serialis]KAH9926200.1 kinase-like domain-containing protein [Neoantrodia serialis]
MLSSRSSSLPATRKHSFGEARARSSTPPSDEDDEDDVNHRIRPNWCGYRHIFQCRGFRLDTCRDVKQLYQRYWESLTSQGCNVSKDLPGYLRACSGRSDDELCPDVGLPENLFRGTRCVDGMHVVIKAVHLRSREYDVVRYLSSSPVRQHPMNHCIRMFSSIPRCCNTYSRFTAILGRIEIPADDVAFIVMEEWSPHLDADPPYTLRGFLGFMRQHLEHVVFMHAHRIAHLDISIRNTLTDNKQRYACIDFELSRRFDMASPRIRCLRATEPPPEVERGESCDPYKIDVWASGMLMLKASQLTGLQTPDMLSFITRLLDEDATRRPTARQALSAFNNVFRNNDAKHTTG